MLNSIAKRSALKVIGAAAVMGSGLLAADASANLSIELYATSATGGATVSADGTSVTGVSVGTVVSYNVVAQIYGSNVTNPGFQSAAGGIYSTAGAALVGDLTQANTPTFATGAYLNGTGFAGPNGQEWGPSTGPTAVVNTSTGRISYLAASVVSGSSIVIGTGTYTVTSLNGASSTALSFSVGSVTTLNKNPLWRETGPTAAVNASTGHVDVAAPLIISAGTVTATPALSLTSTTHAADFTVTGNAGGGFPPTKATPFTAGTSGDSYFSFTPTTSTVIVALDLTGSSSDISNLITTLGLKALTPSGGTSFLGLAGSYDATATFSGVPSGTLDFDWKNFGNVTLSGIAVVPEPTSAMGLLGVAALGARRRRA